MNVFSEYRRYHHRGEGMKAYWSNNSVCPTEAEYKQMTVRTIGGLFLLDSQLMQLFSDNEKDFTSLAAVLGLYFQIRQDYVNCSEEVGVAILLGII